MKATNWVKKLNQTAQLRDVRIGFRIVKAGESVDWKWEDHAILNVVDFIDGKMVQITMSLEEARQLHGQIATNLNLNLSK